EIQAWSTRNNIVSRTTAPNLTWLSMGGTPDGMLFWTVTGLPDLSGHAKVALRLERFVAGEGMTSGPALSETYAFEIDCDGSKVRQAAIATYTLHNLAGTKQEVAEPTDWETVDANHLLGDAKAQVCALERTAAVAARDPNMPDLSNPQA